MSNQDKQTDEGLQKKMDEIEKAKRQEKRVLRLLIDQAKGAENKHLAVYATMGTSNSYISSVPLKWFADTKFASELSIFEEHRDDANKSIEINKDTLDLLSQRKPDWSRQLVMTVYLAIREHHKFPPALLVAYQDWIGDLDHDNWGMDGRALKDSIENEPLDSQAWVVNLNQTNTDFYTLDGQHRLMAVKGLRDLIQGNLFRKNKDGKTGKIINIEDILEHPAKSGYKSKEELKRKIESILNDELIGVEIIPAVQRGETRDEAFMRLRQTFVDVNQNARRIEKGELVLLDETDGFKIVARNVMILHRLFYTKDNSIRVHMKSPQLTKSSEHYTTLQTIANIAKTYLEQHDKFIHWNDDVCKIKGAGSVRPENKELEAGEKKLTSYFNAIMTLPSHKLMIEETKKVSELRGYDEGDYDNVLFRPIAQEALAKAIGYLEKNKGFTPEQVCKKLSKKDNPNCPDLKLTDIASPFFGVLCETVENKMRKTTQYLKLAEKMFIHLLGDEIPDEDEREEFREGVFQSRRSTPEGEEPAKAINFDGQHVPFDKFELPRPW